MGPHLTFHLAGGTGGIEHFMSHLAVAVESWWPDLGAPELTPELKQKIIDGVRAEAAGRSIAELAAARDRILLEYSRGVARRTGNPSVFHRPASPFRLSARYGRPSPSA